MVTEKELRKLLVEEAMKIVNSKEKLRELCCKRALARLKKKK